MNFVNSKFLKGTVINFRIFFYYNLLSSKLLKFHFIPFVIIFFWNYFRVEGSKSAC